MNFNRFNRGTNLQDNVNNKIETGIGPVTDRLLGTVIDRLANSDFREILTDKIVDPITEVVNRKIRPYIYAGVGLYTVLVVLLAIIIYLLMKKKN